MMRMEMACFFILMLVAILYFSAKREKTRIHKIFSLIMVFSMLHLAFDAATIYTVNHRNTLPLWLNEGAHRVFIGSMVLLFYLFYRYITLLIREETGKKTRGFWIFTAILGVAIIGAVFLPLYYKDTELGSYSYGPAASMAYFSVAVNLLGVIFALARYWKGIHLKKKMGITAAMLVEVVISIYQAAHPLALLSGMGITLMVLSIYLTMENPDILLVEQIEKEKQRAEAANEAKSAFLSNMSHEIRTPMNAVVGMAELLLGTEVTEEQREYLGYIKNSGNALVSIINDILDLSKIESGKMELTEQAYELLPMLRDIRMMIENRIGDKPVELLYEIDDSIPKRLLGDDLRIRQIIINLLSNAVKFTDKGHVKLKIDGVSINEECIALKFSVSDTGQGIRSEDIKKLFQAFEQVDVRKNRGKEGTGLGLSISSNLIGMMGGKLEVCSVYGEGSEFYFTIDQKIASGESENTDRTHEGKFTAPGAKVLVVDDSVINLKVAIGLMKPLGMEIDTAMSGRQSLEMVKEKKYDIIFMDHMMPEMDGVETTEQLRAMKDSYVCKVPIIGFSANAMKEARDFFAEAGMNGFVAKPIEVRELFRTIRKWLPKNLIQEEKEPETSFAEKASDEAVLNLKEISVQDGVKNTGSTERYMEILGDFCLLIDSKSIKIERCMEDENIRDYTVEVHALKSAAYMIGAFKLSEEFADLEQYGQEDNMDAIRKKTPQVLAHYRSYKETLNPFLMKNEGQKREVSKDEILMYLRGISDSIAAFDLDEADKAMEKLEECRLPEATFEKMQKLRVAMADVDMEDVLDIVGEIGAIVEQV